MLDKHALIFTDAVAALDDAKTFSMAIDIPGEHTSDARAKVKAAASNGFRHLRRACILSDMQEVLPQIDRLQAMILPPDDQSHSSGTVMAHGIRDLIDRIRDDLESQFYFHLDQRDVPFYLTQSLFGDHVAFKFPKAIEDIDEAGKCLALQRPTACVFHLMRVLEQGVQTLGRKLKITINVQTESWHQIVVHIHNASLHLPSKTRAQKKKKSAIAEAAANLQSVRLAWRNEVMHPKQTYSREDALNIFNAAKVFMASLAELV